MTRKSRLMILTSIALMGLFAFELWHSARRLPRATGVVPEKNQKWVAKRCSRLFQEFCRKSPDFGIDVFTDPTGEVWLDSESETAVREAAKHGPNWISSVFSPSRRARISEVERWVKREMIAWVQSQPERLFRGRDKHELLWRIRATSLDFPDPVRGYPDDPELLLHSQAQYERLGSQARGVRRLRFGGAYVLGTTSRFNLAFTIAHELAHAIDPCELRSTGWAIPAFDRLAACFTSEGLVATPKSLVECRRNDQLSETFADWVAVKMASRALNKWGAEYPEPQRWASVGNSIRDLCEEDEDLPGIVESHPDPRIRIERVLCTDTEILKYLGCPASKTLACSLE